MTEPARKAVVSASLIGRPEHGGHLLGFDDAQIPEVGIGEPAALDTLLAGRSAGSRLHCATGLSTVIR